MLRKIILTAATLGLANKVYREYRAKQAGGGSLSPAGSGPATDIAGHELDDGEVSRPSPLGTSAGLGPVSDRPLAH